MCRIVNPTMDFPRKNACRTTVAKLQHGGHRVLWLYGLLLSSILILGWVQLTTAQPTVAPTVAPSSTAVGCTGCFLSSVGPCKNEFDFCVPFLTDPADECPPGFVLCTAASAPSATPSDTPTRYTLELESNQLLLLLCF